MKALGLVVSDKIFESCILKNHLNNFGRGLPRDHSCKVWSKSNEWFQRRRCLSKKVYGRRTSTDDGQRPVTIAHPEHFVLRWAKKENVQYIFLHKRNNNAVLKELEGPYQMHTKRTIKRCENTNLKIILMLICKFIIYIYILSARCETAKHRGGFELISDRFSLNSYRSPIRLMLLKPNNDDFQMCGTVQNTKSATWMRAVWLVTRRQKSPQWCLLLLDKINIIFVLAYKHICLNWNQSRQP